MKRIFLCAFLGLTIITWLSVFGEIIRTPKQIRDHIENARAYEKQEIYIKAINEYEAALQLDKKSYDIRIALAEDYARIDQQDQFQSMCQQAIDLQPNRETAYLLLADYWKEQGQTAEFVSLLKKAKESVKDSEKLDQMYQELEGQYTVIKCNFSDMTDFYHGYATGQLAQVENEETRTYECLVNEAGEYNSDILFQKVVPCGENHLFIRCDETGKWELADDSGYTAAATDKELMDAHPFSQGYSSVEMDGNMAFSQIDWDYIGSFVNGYAPAKKEGKWAMVNQRNLNAVTEYQYDDIKMNDFGAGFYGKRAFAKKNGVYQLINEKGETVGKETFSDARAFESEQPAAAQQNGKWGFVNQDGEWFIEPVYDDAKSFSNGYAAVKVGTKWGYLNSRRELVIAPQFAEAKNVTKNGVAPVSLADGVWDIMQITILQYES